MRNNQNTRPEGSLAAKLGAVAAKVRRSNSAAGSDIRNPYQSPDIWEKDGLDHINIWEHGQTDLGKFLVHSSRLPFKHSIFGQFNSMESFWYYIQSVQRDDRVRTMFGKKLKDFASRLTQTRVTNFRAIIMDSNYQRIKQYSELADAIKESTLPFDVYYEDKNTGLRNRPNYFMWFLWGMEEIRSALKEDREPDFSSLMDDKKGGNIYEHVLPRNYKSPEEKAQEAADATKQDTERAPQVPSLLSGLTNASKDLSNESIDNDAGNSISSTTDNTDTDNTVTGEVVTDSVQS